MITRLLAVLVLSVALEAQTSQPPAPSSGNPNTDAQKQSTTKKQQPASLPVVPAPPVTVEVNVAPPNVTVSPPQSQQPNNSGTDADWWMVGTNIAIVLITFAIAITAGVQAYKQAKATRESLELTRASAGAAQQSIIEMRRQIAIGERPWIKVTVTPGPLQFNSNHPQSVSIDFKFTMKNVGKSVALDVHPRGQLFLQSLANPYQLDEGIRRQKLMCEQAETDSRPIPENPFPMKFDYYLFPDEEREFTVSASTATGEIERETLPRLPDSTSAYIQPYFAGCVEYRFSFQGEWHHTFVNYTVMRFHKEQPDDLFGIGKFKVGENYPADEIWLAPSFKGGNYVD